MLYFKKIILAVGFHFLLFNLPVYADVTRVEANNGNLIMEDIPPIPQLIKDDLHRFQNVRSAPFRDWTRDGNGIYITTRFGDVRQLHRVDRAGGSRRQLTFFDEPVSSVSRQPGGNLISFAMDAGGSEYSQLFLLDPESGQSRMISDGESRNRSALWNRNGSAIAYSSTRRNGASNDLWISEIGEPENSRMILESPDGSWWGPGDWSANDRKLLIQQYISVTDSRIHLLDIETGDLTLLKGSAETPSVNIAIAFDKSGDGFYFLTDTNIEFAKLAYQRFAQPEHVVITHDIPWDVDEVAISNDRNRLAFSVNAGG
ncbi:MAG: S9 family peptidase, partial [Gammaproteobacteria bacterium]|nr:S9 family peptidase [Gammaproteobacteria bacterium]